MNKHDKLVNILQKIYILEYKTRSFNEIRKRIEYYEKRNLELASKCPNGIPEGVQKEIYDIDTKIRELKWTIYDD
jgi:antitoxin component YwqK of YwqJK toxin-antitoxin module